MSPTPWRKPVRIIKGEANLEWSEQALGRVQFELKNPGSVQVMRRREPVKGSVRTLGGWEFPEGVDGDTVSLVTEFDRLDFVLLLTSESTANVTALSGDPNRLVKA